MKFLAWLIIVCATSATLTGCVESLDGSHYVIDCKIDESIAPDSVSLFILDENYNRVLKVNTVALDSTSRAFHVEGNVQQPCVAYFKFSNDSTPFYFVLEPGESLVEIGSNSVIVQAGDYNHQYFTYLNRRSKLLAQRKQVMQDYLSALGPDSLIDIETERELLVRDSLIGDSMRQLTVEMINSRGPVARIVRERYLNTLSRASVSKIK